VNLWRIAAETRKFAADDLSGGGAAAHPGRWNDDMQAVVYAAPSIALAVLETAAHIDAGGLPLNRFVVRIDVPDAVWAAREELDVATLPATWAAIPAGKTSVRIGSEWIASRRSAILLVPSVIVPEEWAALINPAHPDARKLTATVTRRFEYDKLFRSV
jgi:RES domain-containing protein